MEDYVPMYAAGKFGDILFEAETCVAVPNGNIFPKSIDQERAKISLASPLLFI